MNNPKILLIGIFILVALAVTVWITLSNKTEYQEYSNKQIINIHKTLHSLSAECRYGRFENAQNTFLDLHQEWQRVEIINNNATHLGGLTTDSLAALGQMIDRAALISDNEPVRDSIILQIKYINDRLED